jgi:hypothetical protein
MNGEQAEKAPEANKAIFAINLASALWLSEAYPARLPDILQKKSKNQKITNSPEIGKK